MVVTSLLIPQFQQHLHRIDGFQAKTLCSRKVSQIMRYNVTRTGGDGEFQNEIVVGAIA
jgi:hypothetical protein